MVLPPGLAIVGVERQGSHK